MWVHARALVADFMIFRLDLCRSAIWEDKGGRRQFDTTFVGGARAPLRGGSDGLVTVALRFLPFLRNSVFFNIYILIIDGVEQGVWRPTKA